MTPFVNPRLGDHVCLPFDTDAQLLAFTCAYVTNGLRAGRRVLVLTDSLTPAATRSELRRAVPRLASAEATGQLELRSSVEAQLSGGRFDPAASAAFLRTALDCARQAGWAGLALLADMSWAGRRVPGAGELSSFEAAVNPLFASGGLTATCLYDRRAVPADRMRAASAAHPLTPGQAELRFAAATDPPGLILYGEADLTNAAALAGLLAPYAAQPGDVTLDARELTFADLAALRTLLSLDQRPGRQVTILAGPILTHLMRLLGIDERADLSIREADYV